jgi:dienelactone hydrolase
MFLSRLVAFAWFLAVAAALHGQTAPEEYATFMSHGKAVACPVYGNPDAIATMIFLHGPSPADLALGRLEANFFAEHGFRVLLPDYLSATTSVETTAVNYRRWAQVVEDIVAELHASPVQRNKKIALAGQGLGASVALVSASQKMDVDAVVEWSGLLPNQFFSQMQSLPPLLIVHGEQDKQVPVVNARQLIRLCKLKDFTCDAEIYPTEGHVFTASAMDSANQRILAFFRTYLWSSLPKRAE